MGGLVYLFPGQGSQKVGMGRDLFAQSLEARAVFEQADRTLGTALSKLCFEGPADELTDTVNAQPAILVTSIAMLRMAQAAGAPQADWVAGHSLGHFSALVAAGSLELPSALHLVRERGRAMNLAGQQRPGRMAAIIKLDAGQLDAVCRRVSAETGQYVGIANDNAPDQIVIAGETDALEKACQLAKDAGAKRVVPLAVSVASHSPLLAGAAETMKEVLRDIEVRRPAVPLISNVTAQPLDDPQEIKADIIQQLTSPVKWTASIETIVRQGGATFVEVGPGSVLTGLVKRIVPSAEAWSLEDPDGLSKLLALAGSK